MELYKLNEEVRGLKKVHEDFPAGKSIGSYKRNIVELEEKLQKGMLS